MAFVAVFVVAAVPVVVAVSVDATVGPVADFVVVVAA